MRRWKAAPSKPSATISPKANDELNRRMSKSRHLRSAGFSLLEILIVVGLLGIVTLGSITVVTNMNRATKGVQFAGEVNSFSDDVRGLLGGPAPAVLSGTCTGPRWH